MNIIKRPCVALVIVAITALVSCSSEENENNNPPKNKTNTKKPAHKPASTKKLDVKRSPVKKKVELPPAKERPSHISDKPTGYTGHLIRGIRTIDSTRAMLTLTKIRAAMTQHVIMNKKYPDKLEGNFARQCGLSQSDIESVAYIGKGMSSSTRNKVVAYVCASRLGEKYMVLYSGSGDIKLVPRDTLEAILEKQLKK